MNRWRAYIKFIGYEAWSQCWARDKAEATKYFKKHYPLGEIIKMEELPNEDSAL